MGTALVAYSHILSLIIIFEIFVVIIIVACLLGKYRQFLSRWRQILASIVLWILLVLPVIYFFYYAYFGKGISSAAFGIVPALLPKLTRIIEISFEGIDTFGTENVPYGIGTILIVSLMVGWYQAKKSVRDMWIYLVGIGLVFMASSYFPWIDNKDSPLAIIQLPIRYLSYASIFLAIIASKLIVKVIKRLNLNWVTVLILCTLISIIGYKNSQRIYTTNMEKGKITKLSNQVVKKPLPSSYINKVNYTKQFNYQVMFGETDYYPNRALKNSKSIIKQKAFFNNRSYQIESKSKANKLNFVFDADEIGSLDLPIIAYYGTYAEVNGKKTDVKISNRGTVLINLSKKGKQNITVGYKPGMLFYISIIIAILTWLFLITLKILTIKNKELDYV